VAIDQYVKGKRHGVYIVIGKTRSEWVNGKNTGSNTYKSKALDESNNHYNENLKNIYLDSNKGKKNNHGDIAYVRMDVKNSRLHGKTKVFREYEKSKRRNYLYKSALEEYKNGLKDGMQLYWTKTDGHSPLLCSDKYVHSYVEPGMYVENEDDTFINYAELCQLADPRNFYEFPEHLMLDFFSSNVLPPFYRYSNVNKMRSDISLDGVIRVVGGNPMDLEVSNFNVQYPGGIFSRLEIYNKGVMTYGEKYLDYTDGTVKNLIKNEVVEKGSLINVVGDYSKKTAADSTSALPYKNQDAKKFYFDNNYPKLSANRLSSIKKKKRSLECDLTSIDMGEGIDKIRKKGSLCSQDAVDAGNIEAFAGRIPIASLAPAFIFRSGRDGVQGKLKIIESRWTLRSVFYNNLIERDLPIVISEFSHNDNMRRNYYIKLYYHDWRNRIGSIGFSNEKSDDQKFEREVKMLVNNKADESVSPIKLFINSKENKYKVRHNKEFKHKVSSNCSTFASSDITFYRKFELSSTSLSSKERASFAGLNEAIGEFKIDGRNYKHRKDYSKDDIKDRILTISTFLDGKFKKVEGVKFGKLGCTIIKEEIENKNLVIEDDNDFMSDLFGDI
jgi:hypothetical protein